MHNEIKFQVFISSTYQDLLEERRVITEHIIGLGYHPVGMEYFNLSNDSIWEHIKKLIEASDYYILIIGSRYGTESDLGLSYTQQEYMYAKELKKPIKVLVLDKEVAESKMISADRETREKQKKLSDFRSAVTAEGVEFWSDPSSYLRCVSKIGRWILDTPTEGWIRGHVKSENEILRYLFNSSHDFKDIEVQDDSIRYLPQKSFDMADVIQCIDTIRQKFLISRMPHSVSSFFTYKVMNPPQTIDDYSGQRFEGQYRMALSSNKLETWRVGKYIGKDSSLHYSYQSGQSRVLPDTTAPTVNLDQKTIGEKSYCCIPIFYNGDVVAHIGLSSPNENGIQRFVKYAEEAALIFEVIFHRYKAGDDGKVIDAQDIRCELNRHFESSLG